MWFLVFRLYLAWDWAESSESSEPVACEKSDSNTPRPNPMRSCKVTLLCSIWFTNLILIGASFCSKKRERKLFRESVVVPGRDIVSLDLANAVGRKFDWRAKVCVWELLGERSVLMLRLRAGLSKKDWNGRRGLTPLSFPPPVILSKSRSHFVSSPSRTSNDSFNNGTGDIRKSCWKLKESGFFSADKEPNLQDSWIWRSTRSSRASNRLFCFSPALFQQHFSSLFDLWWIERQTVVSLSLPVL